MNTQLSYLVNIHDSCSRKEHDELSEFVVQGVNAAWDDASVDEVVAKIPGPGRMTITTQHRLRTPSTLATGCHVITRKWTCLGSTHGGLFRKRAPHWLASATQICSTSDFSTISYLQ